jgi:hypothetical protein
MKLDVNPFPVDAIDFEEKKVLVWTNQAATTIGKNIVVSDDLRVRMLKRGRNLEEKCVEKTSVGMEADLQLPDGEILQGMS